MDELECMRIVNDHILSVAEESARARVVSWLAAKYLHGTDKAVSLVASSPRSPVIEEGGRSGQIPGIAKLSQSGEVQLTVRDLKAKSANDAAIRLVHIAIWSATKLTGELSLSSKRFIVPLLRKYRCYDGNTRGAIASDKGLVREGDLLSLDFHAEQYAEKVVAEVLDPTTEGKWKPSSSKRRTSHSSRGSAPEAV